MAGPRARRRRWLGSRPPLPPAALAPPRAAGDGGGGVCGKPCVSAVTWAGRGLGDVRGLCVAMCVGFGAAPAQLKGAGERRRRAQVRPGSAGRTRREAGARDPRGAGGGGGSGEFTQLVELPGGMEAGVGGPDARVPGGVGAGGGAGRVTSG